MYKEVTNTGGLVGTNFTAFCKIVHYLKTQGQAQSTLYVLIIKANDLHYFSYLFDKVLYMCRTGPSSGVS
jgi:hypothetical protein